MRNRLFALACLGLGLCLVVVGLGVFTRLVGAGLGCPDWPGCYGHLLWPTSDADLMVAQMLYPQSPVDHSKTWPEMVHRYAAGLLGLLIMALALVMVWRRGDAPGLPWGLAVALLALVVCQALFGAWTVTWRLLPQVVVAHLLGGFCTLALLWALCWRLVAPGARPAPVAGWLAGLLWAGVVVLVLQIALGGWVSSNYAALACTELPWCGGAADWAAAFDLGQPIGPDYSDGRLDGPARRAIHLAHRLGAVAVAGWLAVLAAMLWRAGRRGNAVAMAAMLAVQLGLGVANVWLHLPLWVAVAHNLGAALLLLAVLAPLVSAAGGGRG